MNKTATTVATASAALALALTGCGGGPSADEVHQDCMSQATADAVEATGQPAEDFAGDSAFATACDLHVHTYMTIPDELGETPDAERVIDTVACIGSAAEAAYLTDSHAWGSPYSADMTYPEIFERATVASSC